MILDRIGGLSYAESARGQFSQNFEKRKLTHILIVSDLPLGWNDRLKVVVRDKGALRVAHDYTRGTFLQGYHDFKYGANPSVKNGLFSSDIGVVAYKKPFGILVPIGHLTLGDKLQMEVEFEHAAVEGATGNQDISFFAYHKQDAPDHLIHFFQTADTDTTQYGVREVFALPKSEGGFVNSNGTYPDLRFEIETRNYQTSNSVKDLLAVTAAIGNYELPLLSNFVILGQFPKPLPESKVRIKRSGDDACLTSFMVVKEQMVSTTSDSTLEQVKELAKDVKDLESKEPETAKKYRHAGATVKSSELQAAVNEIEAGKAADEGK